MGWIKKNLGIILSILLVTFTIAVFGPLELYCTNSGEFWFSFKDAIVMTLILAVVCAGILSLISFLLRGKARNVFGAFVFAAGVALYIQGNYANINYGTLDGTEIDWNAYPVYAVLDTVGWVIVIGGLLILYLKNKKWFKNVQTYASLYILGIQIFTLITLFLTTDVTTDKSDYYLSNEGMYEISENDNIIIFVLDAFDDAYFQEIYNENSIKYEEVFADFTYFDNATVAAARTKAAMPAILTGEAYPGQISYVDYLEESFDNDGLYSELKRQNYDVRVYTTSVYVPDKSTELIDNQEMDGYVVSSYIDLSQKYFDLTLYKYVPHILKQFFWLYTGDFDQYKKGATAESYVTNDAEFFADMELTVMEEGNAFRLYHLNGPHGPYWLNEYAQKQNENTDVKQQAKGSLYIVEKYISQMKELGVYDNSTIIIMADHGDSNENYNIDNEAHGILFVKTKDSKTDFTISSMPVSYFDLHATIFSALNIDKGDTFFDILDVNRTRLFYHYFTEKSAFVVREYAINGDIDNKDSMQSTGRVFSPMIKKTEYEYDTMLSFGVDSTALPFVVSGVSGTDGGNYSWTTGKECIFELDLKRYPESNLLIAINTVGVFSKNGPQEIIGYVNDKLCYQAYVTKAGTIKFIVPNDLIGNDNKLLLRLELPNAISPRELYGGAEDERSLSLALSGLCISETLENPEPLYSQLPDEQKIICTVENNNSASFLKHGFSNPEKSFTWTNGKSASFSCGFKEEPSNDLRCTIKLTAIYGDYQNVTIYSKGTKLYSQKLDSKDREISFVVPKNCASGGVFSCLIELPDAVSPLELGKSDDKRALALAVKEIGFSEITDKNNN